ncbi:ECF-type sigma factor [Psychrobium sp. 1_MG-2023]|uniref:ECF-type sigma factor n=1 Tax=Psychrobium sp. 1_MG-2023 TaxID=3062624 RepID=UPI000C3298B9|nr:ECF-type sigma factor [Psychrobium sp. 1_MG-2023]MDP2559629.1 ECF-type sigma factor [Psychrobium sp. 1_MG-2023]PKF59462.1 RNA polymerase subunit sigma [Alteromonadales bacterium alter-6D02]
MGIHNNDTTDLIKQWSLGDKASEEKLFTLTYQQFKMIARDARSKLPSNEGLNITANLIHSTTSLVHDAYIKLAPGVTESIDSKKQFYLLLSKVMRHILVDYHRKNEASKRQYSKSISNNEQGLEDCPLDYIAIDKAIVNLTKDYPRQAETIQLRYFHGLKNKEIAELHQISESLVDKDLKFSKSWMRLHA